VPRQDAPEVSVVVASHERAARLSILLEALAGQTLPRERWELVVVHTYQPEVADCLLAGHELARTGSVRQVRVDPSEARPSRQRNLGWRAARAPLIAFTDDDCRPEPDWIERLVEGYRSHPGAFVQGATRPDPRDGALGQPHVRTLEVHPPGRFVQTCNVLYERVLLDRLEGFDEQAITGEDIDLSLRAQSAGAWLVGAPDALVYHAVEALTWREKVRSNQKWEHLAYVVKRHPELRKDCCMRIWWKREHFRAALALVGLMCAIRRPWTALATLPYYRLERYRFGRSPRGRLRALRWMPEFWLIELAEVVTFLRGSLRYRTLLL
jgi:GT2 family glycosyltransferase